MGEEKKNLASQHTKVMTTVQVLALLCNVALLIVSHTGISAVVKSSICAGEADCGESSFVPSGLVDQCLDNESLYQLSPDGPFYKNFTEVFEAIGLFVGLACNVDTSFSCFNLTTQSQFENYPLENTGLSTGCKTCFAESIACSSANCFDECITSVTGTTLECADCSEAKCDPAFLDCSGGVEIPPFEFGSNAGVPVADYAGCTPRDDLGITMYTVFTVYFIDSIVKSWEGGAYGLSLIIAIASGFWPYMKNILMAVTWFVPLTVKKRDQILQWLAWLGKWSLVDVFAVTLILSGIRIDKILGLTQDSALIVITESRLAIYTFGTAALWALVQGEYIRHLGRELKRKEGQVTVLEKAVTEEDKASSELDKPSGKQRLLLGTLSMLALVFALAGLFTVNTSFELQGIVEDLPGPSSYDYSAIELATALVDECALQGNESINGTYYLACLFLLMGLIFPIINSICFILTALVPPNHPKRPLLAQMSRSFSYFAALDVYFISLLILISQFEGLISASLGEEVEERCPSGPDGTPCLSFKGNLEFGSYLVLVGCVFFIAAQISLAYIYPMRMSDHYMVMP